eukprot:TRINITY_DN6868_c2_g1_i1.p1 TRINITY_DN6868_c2_g1~~TRINITY_DN6868_c2_g1_i1.p1  ORF type:complete len:3389 (+),score=716.44 TRINITY_DN6868_c2_g1_i1:22-10188(+)
MRRRAPSDAVKLRALLDDYCITSPSTNPVTPSESVGSTSRPDLSVEIPPPVAKSPHESPTRMSLTRSDSPIAQEVGQVQAITDSLLTQLHQDAEHQTVNKLVNTQKLRDGLEQVGEQSIREALEQHFDLQRTKEAAEKLPHLQSEYERLSKEVNSLKIENKALKAETRLLQRNLQVALDGEISDDDEAEQNPRLRAFKKNHRQTLPSIRTGKVAEELAKVQLELQSTQDDLELLQKELLVAKKTSQEDSLRASDAEEKALHAMKSCKDATERAISSEQELETWIKEHTHEINLRKEKIELEAIVAGSERKLVALTTELQQTVDKNVIISEDLEVSKSRCQILEQELRQLGSHLEAITAKNATKDNELVDALAQISTSTQQLTDNDRLYAENRRISQENVSLTKRTKDLTAKLGKAEAELAVNAENGKLINLLNATAPGREILEDALKNLAVENEGLAKLASARSNTFREENNKGVQTTHIMGEGYLSNTLKSPGQLLPSDIWGPATPRKRSQTTISATQPSGIRMPSNEADGYWYQLHSKYSNLERHRSEIDTALVAIDSGEAPHGWEGMIPRARNELERLGNQGGIVDTFEILSDPKKALECELDMVQAELRLTKDHLFSAITERRAGLAASITEDEILSNLQLELKASTPSSPSPKKKNNIVSVLAASCTFQPPSAKISLTVCGSSEPAYILSLGDLSGQKSPAIINVPQHVDYGQDSPPGLDLRIEVLDSENTILGVTEQYIVPYTGGREEVAIKIEGMSGSLVLNIHNAVTKLDVLNSRGVETKAICQPEPLVWIQTPRQFTGVAALTRMLQQRHIKHVNDIEVIHVDMESQLVLLRVVRPKHTATTDLIKSVKNDLELAVGCGTGVPRIERLDKKNVATADEFEPTNNAYCTTGVQTIADDEHETIKCVTQLHTLSNILSTQQMTDGLGTGCRDTDESLAGMLSETYEIIRRLTKQAIVDASPPRVRIAYNNNNDDIPVPDIVQDLFSVEFSSDSLFVSQRIASCSGLLSRLDPPFSEAVHENLVIAFSIVSGIVLSQPEALISYDVLFQCASNSCRVLADRISSSSADECSFAELFLSLRKILLSDWQPHRKGSLRVNHVVSTVVECCRNLIQKLEDDDDNDTRSEIQESLSKITSTVSGLKSAIDKVTWHGEQHSSTLAHTISILETLRSLDEQLETEGIGSGNIEVDLEVSSNLQEAKLILLKVERQAILDASPPRTRQPVKESALTKLTDLTLEKCSQFITIYSAYQRLYKNTKRSKRTVIRSLSGMVYRTPMVSCLWYWFSKWSWYTISQGYHAVSMYNRRSTVPVRARPQFVTVTLSPHHVTAVECTSCAMHYPVDNPNGVICGFGDPQQITLELNSTPGRDVHFRWSILNHTDVVSTGYHTISKETLLANKVGGGGENKMIVLLDKHPGMLYVDVSAERGFREQEQKNIGCCEHPKVSLRSTSTSDGIDMSTDKSISLALKSIEFQDEGILTFNLPLNLDIHNNSFAFQSVDEMIALDGIPTDFIYFRARLNASLYNGGTRAYSTVSLLSDLSEINETFTRDITLLLYPDEPMMDASDHVIEVVLTLIIKSFRAAFSPVGSGVQENTMFPISPVTSPATEPDEFHSVSPEAVPSLTPTCSLRVVSVQSPSGPLSQSSHHKLSLTSVAGDKGARKETVLINDSFGHDPDKHQLDDAEKHFVSSTSSKGTIPVAATLQSRHSSFVINKNVSVPCGSDSHLTVEITDKASGVKHTSEEVAVKDIQEKTVEQITVDSFKVNIELEKQQLFLSYSVVEMQFDPVLQHKPERSCKVTSSLPGGDNSGSEWFSIPEEDDTVFKLPTPKYVECFTTTTTDISTLPVLFCVVMRCADTPNSVPRDKVFTGIIPFPDVKSDSCKVTARSDGNDLVHLTITNMMFSDKAQLPKKPTKLRRPLSVTTPPLPASSDENGNDNDEASPKVESEGAPVQRAVLKRLQTRKERKQKQLNSSLTTQKEREPLARESLFDNASFGTAEDALAASFGSVGSSRSGFSSPPRRAPRKALKMASQLAPLTKEGSLDPKGSVPINQFTDSYLSELKAMDEDDDPEHDVSDRSIRSPTLPPLPFQSFAKKEETTEPLEDSPSLNDTCRSESQLQYPDCLWQHKLEPHTLPSWDPVYLYPKKETVDYPTDMVITSSVLDDSSFVSEFSESRMDGQQASESLVYSDNFTTMHEHIGSFGLPRSPLIKQRSTFLNATSQTTRSPKNISDASTEMTPLEAYSMSVVVSRESTMPGSPRRPLCANKSIMCELQSAHDTDVLLRQLSEVTSQRDHAEKSADGLLQLVQEAAAREESTKRQIAELQSKIDCHHCDDMRKELHAAERILRRQEEAIISSVKSAEAGEHPLPSPSLPTPLHEYFDIRERCPDERRYNELVSEVQQIAKEAPGSHHHRLNSLWALIASQEKVLLERDEAAEAAVATLLTDPILLEVVQRVVSIGDDRTNIFNKYVLHPSYENTSAVVSILKSDPLLLSLIFDFVKSSPPGVELPPEEVPISVRESDPLRAYAEYLAAERGTAEHERSEHNMVKVIQSDEHLWNRVVGDVDYRVRSVSKYVSVSNQTLSGKHGSGSPSLPEAEVEAAQQVVDVVLRDSLLTDLLTKEMSHNESDNFDIVKSLVRYVQFSNMSESWCHSPGIEKKRATAATAVVGHILSDDVLRGLLITDRTDSKIATIQTYVKLSSAPTASVKHLRQAATDVVDQLLCDKLIADVMLSRVESPPSRSQSRQTIKSHRSLTPVHYTDSVPAPKLPDLPSSENRSLSGHSTPTPPQTQLPEEVSLLKTYLNSNSNRDLDAAGAKLIESLSRHDDLRKKMIKNNDRTNSRLPELLGTYLRSKDFSNSAATTDAASVLAAALMDDNLLSDTLTRLSTENTSQALHKLQEYELLQKSAPSDNENKRLVNAIHELSSKKTHSEYQRRSLNQLYDTASKQQDLIKLRDAAATSCVSELLKDDILKGVCCRLLQCVSVSNGDLIERITQLPADADSVTSAASIVLSHQQLAENCKQLLQQQDVVSRITGLPSQSSPKRSDAAIKAAVEVLKEDNDLVAAFKNDIQNQPTPLPTSGGDLLQRITGLQSQDHPKLESLAAEIILSHSGLSAACQEVLISGDLITRITGTVECLQSTDDIDKAAETICDHTALLAACMKRVNRRFKSPGIAVTIEDGKPLPSRKLISEKTGIPISQMELGKIRSERQLVVLSVFANTKEAAEEIACTVATRCANPDDDLSRCCNVVDVDILESSSLLDVIPVEQVDVDRRLAWLLKTRASLVNDLFYLHSSLQLGAEQLPAAMHTSQHIMSNLLTEVERLHLGLPAVSSPSSEQKMSSHQMGRLLAHSSAASPTRLSRYQSCSPSSTVLSVSPADTIPDNA